MAKRFIRPRKRHPESGVTLIEMMVVLVIIAIVAAIVVPNVIGRPDQARVTVAQTNIQTIAGALEMYRLDNRQYPTTSQGLEALSEKPSSAPVPQNWNTGGYLGDGLVDPWGSPYQYRYDRQTGRFDLFSLGADGQPGGENLNQDIIYGQ